MVVLLASLFSWICFRQISMPGLYEDEAWSAIDAVRVALGHAIPDPIPYRSVEIFGHSVPFMRNEYVGPVKTYILAGVFSVFGVSVPVLRFATGGMGLFSVVVFYWLVRRQFGRLAAAVAGVLLATDVSFILSVRDDWGPVAFAMLARVLALLALLAWNDLRNRPWLLFLAWMMAGLGLSHKFDFLSFVAAMFIGAVLFLKPAPSLRQAALGVAGFLLGAWPVLWFNVTTHGLTFRAETVLTEANGHSSEFLSLAQPWHTVQVLSQALQQRVGILAQLLAGTPIADWMTGLRVEKSSPLGASMMLWASGIALLAVIYIVIADKSYPHRRRLAFLAAIFGLVLLFLAATPIATGTHHVLALYPFPHLFVGVAVSRLWQLRIKARRHLAMVLRVALGCVVLLVVTSNLFLADAFHKQLATNGGYGYWSATTYDLYDTLQAQYHGETVVLLDWGFEQPLIVLGHDQFNIQVPYWQVVNNPNESSSVWMSTLMHTPNVVFVMWADRFAFSPAVHERLWKTYESEKDLTLSEHKFYQPDGTYLFSILRFSPTNLNPPVLRKLIPGTTRVGQAFNAQPGGAAAIAVACGNATGDTVIVFGTTALSTVFGGPELLTATIPSGLFERPGHYPVHLRNDRGSSNSIDFVVEP